METLSRITSLAALLAVASFGLAGCGGARSTTTTNTVTRTVTTTETAAGESSSAVAASSTGASGSAPRCLTSQLDVQLGTNGAAGSIGLYFTFTNDSGARCSLFGYPGLGLLDAAGNPLATHVLRSPSVVVPAVAERRVTLAPGGAAHAYGGYSDVAPRSCPQAAALEVTPPNAYSHLTIQERLAPCGGIIHVSPVFS